MKKQREKIGHLLKMTPENHSCWLQRKIAKVCRRKIIIEKEKKGCYRRLLQCIGFGKSKPDRHLNLNGQTIPKRFANNKIRNQKYYVLTFVPVVLINQFKFFFNLFFLLIAVSQFVPFLRVGFLFTYIAPLAFVLLITMMKEAYDDFQRYRRDKEINEKQYEKLQGDGQFGFIKSEKIKVGDIVKVNQNERIPADMVLLYTTKHESSNIFIRTDQLDGETDWKLRKSITFTQEFHHHGGNLIQLCEAKVISEPPSALIYNFKGKFCRDQDNDTDSDERLTLENTLWSNTVLASSGYILGLVIYTGNETRAQMNSKNPNSKVGLLDLELNFLSKLLFVLMVLLALTIVISDGFHANWYIYLFRFVLLLSSIIPISLRVNLDMAKIYYSWGIAKDVEIKGTIPRNSTIPEELGRIQYLLSDKTGTLTKNEMDFKKLATEFSTFTVDDLDDIRNIIEKNCHDEDSPAKDLYRALYPTEEDLDLTKTGSKGKSNTMRRKKRRDLNYSIRDLATALAICHNVTPVHNNEGERELQASSPDEVALVKFVESLGYSLERRDQKEIIIKNKIGVMEEFEILECFPFSSDTKRMGIVVKYKKNGLILFFCKGAEVVMKDKVKPQQRSDLLEKCEILAMEGLRTLVIGQKVLSIDEYETWTNRYRKALNDYDRGDYLAAKVRDELETNLDCLGVTGVEDKLQDDVEKTIGSLRGAGIQIWMLTGDKVETATCISISTGLKSRSQPHFFMKEIDNLNEAEFRLKELERNVENSCFMIDGNTLDVCMSNKNTEETFFEIACKAPVVCVCRCSPTQKAIITRKVRKYTGKRVACVGDGGNDVGMILESNVGIGIVGKEGKQASLAGDFSINQFSFLTRLILWHGRLSYKRSALLSQFVIHRGLIISVMQAVFSLVFYHVSIPIYNGFLMLGYSTVYTSLPVFSIVLDKDTGVQQALDYPPLYKTLQKGRSLSFKTFLIWVWKSIFQGGFIMFCCIALFNDSFANLVTITFSSLIIVELLNVYSFVNRFNWKMGVASLLTLLIYIITIYSFRGYFDTSYINGTFLWKIFALTFASWLPLHAYKVIYECFDPPEQKKILSGKSYR
ncbi:unnamed protein product [Moneuplotes crassus]|uniref:Phospholipid-transporting ATPase n=2 Tax=Euplotes crassus TaxID=5936 RepID=A0AAD1XFD3_EUPCR|nr:unnamed protein product [Moneuplotes crassus]